MLELTGDALNLEQIEAVAKGEKVGLNADAARRCIESSETIAQIIREGRTVYGVNTGFGLLSDVKISNEQLDQLQLNLVRSHCCGVGAPLSVEETRVLILLRANVIAKGFSGARLETLEQLILMLNRGVIPVVPERGSVGASGDLAPLAHLALCLVGEGEAFYQGQRMTASEALALANLKPIQLGPKEGLALLNGTQAMCAVGTLALARGERLVRQADVIGVMTLESLLGTPAAFDPRISECRPHPGQIAAARHLSYLCEESEIRESHRENDPRVQDAYSLRCMPQVHGMARGVLEHAKSVLEIETKSATDNPLVFSDSGDVISGGNFHGAPVAAALDYAKIGLTALASMCERRIDRLLNPSSNEGLPPFLATTPGLDSGQMICHVTAAALLNEMKTLSYPSSVDSVPTSGGKEDHVSMGMNAALHLRQVVQNLSWILAVEAIAASQAMSFREPLRPSKPIREAVERVRSVVPPMNGDQVMSEAIEKLSLELQQGLLDL
jgi:histidine ammonia-lyase